MRDYRERLYVPVAWWLLAIPTILILGGTLYAGLPWPWPIIIFAAFTVGCAAPLIALGRATIEVGDGLLRAGKDVLLLAAVSEVVALDEKQSMRLRGPRADPAALLYSRPYLKESVYLALSDGCAAGPGSAWGQRSPLLAGGHQAPRRAGRGHRTPPGSRGARASGMMARRG